MLRCCSNYGKLYQNIKNVILVQCLPLPAMADQIETLDDHEEKIEVFGARVHNLKNIDISIPKNKLVVITGVSGSGKSSLAFDTIYNEGQRRYMESFSAYARQFIGDMERPDVDKITGLSPVISIEQKTTNKNPRSTVGTITEVYDFLTLVVCTDWRSIQLQHR